MLQKPDYVEAYDNLANLFAAQKNEVEALRILSDALKVAPKKRPNLAHQSRIQLRRGAIENAEAGHPSGPRAGAG